jgi:hypothetical protein
MPSSKKSPSQLDREIDEALAAKACFFFVPQTGEISERRPRSNYHAYKIPGEKRKFIEGWIEAATVTPHGLEYPSGFLRTLDVLEGQCRRKAS